MKITKPSEKRRAVAGILAAVILFAMIFTAGLSFFLYQQVLNHSYDIANQYNQNLLGSRTSQQLGIASHPVQGHTTASTKLSAMVTNVGGNSSTIVQFFVRDQLGKLVCLSPALGSTPSCSAALVSSTNVNVLPSNFSMSVGSSVNITTSYASNNAALTGCSTAASCSINLVTALGNVFTGSFPLPNPTGVSITTSLNATSIAPTKHAMDTALLGGATNNAGGTVTYSWFNDGTCGALGGTKTPLPVVVVTNGVVPNSKPQNFSTAGYYSFQAVYSGDANNPGATSACEPLNVNSPGQCVTNLSVSPPVICQATVAQGLGSLAFDFDSFKWYSSGACSAQGPSPLVVIGQNPKSSCTLKDGLVGAWGIAGVKNGPRAYTISQTGMTNAGSNLWFSINVTNADPQQRALVVDQYTQLWFSWFCPEVIGSNGPCAPGPHGQIGTSFYGLVNVASATGVSSTALPTVAIPYGSTVTIFFGLQDSDAGSLPGIPLCGFSGSVPFASQITPVFLFFHGTVGGLEWGMDFPLASTLWTNIGNSC
jgi:flagellin-like protein